MINDVEGLIKEVTSKIKESVDVAVLGMSGGADSTLCALLCREALGPENVYSVHMPMNDLDRETFNSNSEKIANKLELKILHAPIGRIADDIEGAVTAALGWKKLSTVNSGNGRSRARMTVLYGVAHELGSRLKNKVRVIGTGNSSEDFCDYQSKFGDSAADLFIVGDLYKSEVYQLLEYFRDKGLISENNIDRVPSAGLWDGQTDEEELGYSYNEMEPFLRKFLGYLPSVESPDPSLELTYFDVPEKARELLETFEGKERDCAEVVFSRYYSGKHKTEAPPVIRGLRYYCD